MRKNNIIVYNVPESNSEDGAERSKQDREVIRELAKICKENWKKEDIVSAIRLGKRNANGRSRPLQIKLNSEEKKKALFKNLVHLKNAPDKFRNMSIQNDLTKKQRVKEKKLREEAKKMETESLGEDKYRVAGPPWARRIVKTNKK